MRSVQAVILSVFSVLSFSVLANEGGDTLTYWPPSGEAITIKFYPVGQSPTGLLNKSLKKTEVRVYTPTALDTYRCLPAEVDDQDESLAKSYPNRKPIVSNDLLNCYKDKERSSDRLSPVEEIEPGRINKTLVLSRFGVNDLELNFYQLPEMMIMMYKDPEADEDIVTWGGSYYCQTNPNTTEAVAEIKDVIHCKHMLQEYQFDQRGLADRR